MTAEVYVVMLVIEFNFVTVLCRELVNIPFNAHFNA